jgi:peptidoglycan hydrolase-like protein with peptidoglycan-binding domain
LRNCLFAAVVAAAVLLCAPAASFAKDDDHGDGAAAYTKVLRSGGVLAWGDGYARRHGSRAVRALQLRLRTGGFKPGPIDGLFGPLTQAAVRRFQRKHDLKVDGIVGPQTRRPLLAQPAAAQRDRRDASRPAAAKPAPPEPGRGTAAPLEPPAAPVVPPTPTPDSDLRPGPATTSGVSPWIAAALGALGAGLALGAFSLQASRRRGSPRRDAHVAPSVVSDRRRSVGLVLAALLAVFAVGAAVGALFATNASEDERAAGDEDRAALSAERLGRP